MSPTWLQGRQVICLGWGAWLAVLSMCNKVEKYLVNIEMNEGSDEDYTLKHTPPPPCPGPLTTDWELYKGKNCVYLFYHYNPNTWHYAWLTGSA